MTFRAPPAAVYLGLSFLVMSFPEQFRLQYFRMFHADHHALPPNPNFPLMRSPNVLICRWLLLWIGCLPVPGMPCTQAQPHEQMAAIEQDLAYLHLNEAQARVEQLDHPAYQRFYQANLLLYQFMFTQSPTYLQQLQTDWDETIEALERLPEAQPLRQVLLADLSYKRGLAEFISGNYLTALNHLQHARSEIKQNERSFPTYVEHQKILGLFNVAFGAVPRKYQWLNHFLGYKGDIDAGLQQLSTAAAEARLFPQEAAIMAHFVEKNMLDRPRASIARLETLQQQFPDNLILDMCLASSYMSIKENERALALLGKRNHYRLDPRVFFPPFWDYMLAKAYYFKEDYFRAEIYFEQFLRSEVGELFRKDATFKLGMALTLKGDYRQGMKVFQRLVADEGSSFDEDAYAAYMAAQFAQQEPTSQVKALFRARNLFDGGYYERALSVLHQLSASPMNKAHRTELYYRYGRIYHTQGKLAQAMGFYQQCIAQPEQEQQLWLQVYAHYFLGEIAREHQKPEAARVHYLRALEFDDYFYQDGLENRCKAALAALKRR